MSTLPHLNKSRRFSWKKIYDNHYVRVIFGHWGLRRSNIIRNYDFEPFFQYKIGSYQTGYCLWFTRPPYAIKYKIEVFSKMNEYEGHSLIRFLEYHYDLYPDKKEFLRFLYYEAYPYLKVPQKDRFFIMRFQTVLSWIEEQVKIQGITLGDISPVNKMPPPSALTTTNPVPPPEIHLDNFEDSIAEIQRSYLGKATLTHPHHAEKLIQVLTIIQQLTAPGKTAETLFSVFSSTDLASILRNFGIFGELKINTILKKIAQANESLDYREPKTEKLAKALVEFFYGPSANRGR